MSSQIFPSGNGGIGDQQLPLMGVIKMSDIDNIDLDDMDLELDGLDGDMDFSDNPDGNDGDRNPVHSITAGAVDSLRDSQTYVNMTSVIAKNGLPEGYRSAYESLDKGVAATKELYDQAKEELKTPVTKLKKIINKNVDTLPSFIPDSIKGKIRSLSETDDDESLAMAKKVDIQQASIDATLGDIFKRESQQKEAETIANANAKEAELSLVNSQHEQSQDANQTMIRELSKLTTYQDDITYAWQRKTLELQQRQLFLAKDLFAITKASAEDQREANRMLVKNTALPDFLKIQLSEGYTQTALENLYNAGNETLTQYTSTFGSKLLENVKGKVSEFAKNLGDGVDMVGETLETAADIADSGIDTNELLGSQLGGMAADFGSKKISKKLRKYLEDNPKIMENSAHVQYLIENSAQLFSEKVRRYDGFGADFVNGIVPQYGGQRTVLKSSLLTEANEGAPFDNITRRSIIEIIPGFLSRILQQVTTFNTGSESPLLSYSKDSEKFVTKKENVAELKSRLFDRDAEMSKRASESIIARFDKEGKLNEKQRLLLSEQLQNDSIDGRKAFDFEAYKEEGAIKGDTDNSIRKVISDVNYSSKDLLEAARDFRRLNDITSISKNIQESRASGDMELLQELGLINKTNDKTGNMIDNSKITSFLHEDKAEEPTLGMSSDSKVSRDFEKTYGKDFGNIDFSDVIQAVKETAPSLNDLLREEIQGLSAVPVHIMSGWKDPSEASDIAPIISEGFNITHELLREISSKTGVFAEGAHPGYHDGSLFGSIKGMGRGVVSGTNSLIKGYFSGMNNLMTTGGGIIGGAYDRVSKTISSIAGLADTDIYVKGMKFPSIEIRKLKLGEYYDSSTGKSLSSLKGLLATKGNVIDKDGNIVLSLEDIKKGLITPRGANISGLFTAITNPITAAFTLQRDAFNVVMGLPGKIRDGVKKLTSYTGDIYVKGETEPRLLSTILKNGGYISKATGNVIRSLDDIDGDILDLNGNLVLSLNDMRSGLVKPNGEEIKSGIMSSLGRVKDFVLNAGKKALKFGAGMFTKPLEIVSNLTSGLAGKTGKLFEKTLGRDESSILEDIYGHMTKRWPLDLIDATDKPTETESMLERVSGRLAETTEHIISAFKTPKKKSNDADGDGDRDGGWRDLLSRKAKKGNSDDDDEVPEKEEKTSFLDKLLPLAGILTAGFGAVTSAIGTVTSVVSTILSTVTGYFAAKKGMDLIGDGLDMGGLDGKGKGKGRMPGKGGKLSKIGKLATRALGAGKKLLGKSGAIKTAGVMAAKKLGGVAARKVATSMAVKAAGALTAGVVGGVAAPVIAVAGLAYGAYEVFSFFSSRSDAEPLELIRFLQYGIDTNEGFQLAAIRELEDEIEGEITWRGDKPVFEMTIEEAVEEYAEEFDVDLDSNGEVTAWATWFAKRFIPVFMTHLGAAHAIDEDLDLLDIDDDIDEDRIVDYLTRVRIKNINSKDVNPMSITANPFPGYPVGTNESAVRTHIDNLLAKYSKDGKLIDIKPQPVEKPKPVDERQKINRYEENTKANGTYVGKLYSKPKAPAANMTPATAEKFLDIPESGKNLILPIKDGRVSSEFGERIHPITGKRHGHKGVDFAAPSGTPIYAAQAGTIYRQYRSDSYGNVVYIKHADGTSSRYAHMLRFAEGQQPFDVVKQGQLIGYVGNTGNSTGAHLHWEVRTNTEQFGPVVDPLKLVGSSDKRRANEEAKDIAASVKDEKKIGSMPTAEGQNTVASTAKGAAIVTEAVTDVKVTAKPKEPSLNDSMVGLGNAITSSGMDSAKAITGQMAKQENALNEAYSQREKMIKNQEGMVELLKQLVVKEAVNISTTTASTVKTTSSKGGVKKAVVSMS